MGLHPDIPLETTRVDHRRGVGPQQGHKVRSQDDVLAGELSFHKGCLQHAPAEMLEWMENVEKAIQRIMADKVYTSAEFKRERDNFHALCKDLYREEVKKWLKEMLEILMA